MLGKKPRFHVTKSIASAALLGLGMYILYQSLSGAAVCLKNVLSENGSAALGIVPAAILAFSKVPQLCAVEHHRFVPGFIEQTLLSLWPLSVVKVGTIISRGAFSGGLRAISQKVSTLVDLALRRSTLQ
jgi:hypothetical protein